MRTFAQRLYGNVALASVGAAAIFALDMSRPPLVRHHSLTGWILTACIVFLVLFNVRKKVPVLPLLPAATWLQMHVYVGLLAAAVFVMHAGVRYPDGLFNQILWWFFVALTVSGFVGICGERLIARHLRDRGEAVLFNRIGAFRVRLAGEAEELARRSAVELGSPLLVDFYSSRIAPFVAKTRNFWPHLLAIRSPIDRLSREMHELERYLNPRGRETLHEIEERVRAKDNLDHQHALASVMRLWLFLHIPLAYGFLLLIGVHIVLVYAFGGF
ncbi:MAG TPA: hypothetical protein VMF86_10180 [Stellaceae bacterium]|nr:hypothetical protein [Stellaceae bacterium]